MAASPNIRAFIALKTPPDWDDRLRELQRNLAEKLEGTGKYRWVKPTQLHLTLRFLGNVTPEEVETVTSLLHTIAATSAPVTVSHAGLGCFPAPARPRVLWAGLAGSEPLSKLHEQILLATRQIGRPPADRPFQPHLTLARIEGFRRTGTNPLSGLLEAYHHFITTPWLIREVLLMQSHLSPQGAAYEQLATVPLGQSRPSPAP